MHATGHLTGVNLGINNEHISKGPHAGVSSAQRIHARVFERVLGDAEMGRCRATGTKVFRARMRFVVLFHAQQQSADTKDITELTAQMHQMQA